MPLLRHLLLAKPQLNLSSNACLPVAASRPSLTRRRATHPPLPLVCVAKSSASAEENTAPDTSVDVAAVPLGGTTDGCVRRLYETWRWKDRNINFRVEGADEMLLHLVNLIGKLCRNHHRFPTFNSPLKQTRPPNFDQNRNARQLAQHHEPGL